MQFYKQFNNGLKLVINKMDALMSVSLGVLVKTGSINEEKEENGISHFIEHTMFKGTTSRTAFDISDGIDSIGAQINAFTSKEITCYYTKSTSEHLEKCIEILSDIFFDSKFDEEELEKEKGVVIEEINMTEDAPEDLCLDLLAKGYYGDEGLGKTILGPIENIKKFSKKDIYSYMDKYYTADNVVISLAGNVDVEKTVKYIEDYFANRFSRLVSAKQYTSAKTYVNNLVKEKNIEQSHIAFCMPAFPILDKKADVFSLVNMVLGGGMSSRLFQTVREKLGLAYSVYSYPSSYKGSGAVEIYAGVNAKKCQSAMDAIIDEVKLLKKDGITDKEFARGKEQLKSALIMSKENTSSQMLLYGKHLLFSGQELDFENRINEISKLTLKDTFDVISKTYDLSKMSSAVIKAKK